MADTETCGIVVPIHGYDTIPESERDYTVRQIAAIIIRSLAQESRVWIDGEDARILASYATLGEFLVRGCVTFETEAVGSRDRDGFVPVAITAHRRRTGPVA